MVGTTGIIGDHLKGCITEEKYGDGDDINWTRIAELAWHTFEMREIPEAM